MQFLQDPAVSVHNLFLSGPFPGDPIAQNNETLCRINFITLANYIGDVYLRISTALSVSKYTRTYAGIIIRIMAMFLLCEIDKHD